MARQTKQQSDRPHGASSLTRLTAKPKARRGDGPSGSGSFTGSKAKRPIHDDTAEVAGIVKQLGGIGIDISPVAGATSKGDVIDFFETILEYDAQGQGRERQQAAAKAKSLAQKALEAMGATRRAPPIEKPEKHHSRPTSALLRAIESERPVSRRERRERRAAAAAAAQPPPPMSRAQRAIARSTPSDEPVETSHSRAIERLSMLKEVGDEIENSERRGISGEILSGAFRGFDGPFSAEHDGWVFVKLTLMGKRTYIPVRAADIRAIRKPKPPSSTAAPTITVEVGESVRLRQGGLKGMKGTIVGERGGKLLVSVDGIDQGVVAVTPSGVEVIQRKANPSSAYRIFTSSLRRNAR